MEEGLRTCHTVQYIEGKRKCYLYRSRGIDKQILRVRGAMDGMQGGMQYWAAMGHHRHER